MRLRTYIQYYPILLFSLTVTAFCGCTPAIDLSDAFKNWHETEYKGDDGTHFDATVNGQPWYPVWGAWSNWGIWHCDYWKSSQYDYYHLELDVNRWTKDQSQIYIAIDSISGIGSYTLADSTGSYALYNQVGERIYKTNATNTGVVEITDIDTIKRLITGTVHFKAASGDSTIEVTNGSFMMAYH